MYFVAVKLLRYFPARLRTHDPEVLLLLNLLSRERSRRSLSLVLTGVADEPRDPGTVSQCFPQGELV